MANQQNLSVTPSSRLVRREFSIDFGEFNSLRSLLQRVRQDAEMSAIASALDKTGWNRKAAARLLQISYRSILYKIEQYHMNSSGQSAIQAQEKLEPGDGIHLEKPEMDLERVAGRSG